MVGAVGGEGMRKRKETRWGQELKGEFFFFFKRGRSERD